MTFARNNTMTLRLLLLLALLGLPSPALSAGILLLHGLDSPTPWTDAVAAGAAGEAGSGASLNHAYLGGPSVDEDTIDAVAQRLKETLNPAARVVIATDETAGAFAGKYREELFPGAAVVLTGPGQIDPGGPALCGNCVALPLEADLDGTLDLIFDLRPETRLVIGISDSSPRGLAARAALERAMKRREEKTALIFPGHEPGDDEGLDIDRLGQVLGGMPGRSVAVLLWYGEDNKGLPVSDRQLADLFRAHINSPIFVLTDAVLGSGVVGGMLATGRDTGRYAMRTAKRILAGEPAREMLPEPVPATVVLDGLALARFGMTPMEGATVVNAPGTPGGSDEIATGFAPTAAAGLLAFAVLFFLLRRYRQKM
ncbi:hypothetical protein [Pseudodesulfovibrio portus]|uniref:Uncharacterized protein n=1 Tax=Pseudodesulfovibrio portus TaxID=231439 RepID=A0ABM8AS26_9BACT|nr:hypothetical protein [Pseudodesulfovibrio portus]BDQ34240.1 hypothetical protein JCM14722_17820 [Pseudodesulfovibrio portus]